MFILDDSEILEPVYKKEDFPELFAEGKKDIKKSMAVTVPTSKINPMLVPIQKVVHKKGKTHTQVYWVNPHVDTKVLLNTKKVEMAHELAKLETFPVKDAWKKFMHVTEPVTLPEVGEVKMNVSRSFSFSEEGLNFEFFSPNTNRSVTYSLPKGDTVRLDSLHMNNPVVNKQMLIESFSWLSRQGITNVKYTRPVNDTANEISAMLENSFSAVKDKVDNYVNFYVDITKYRKEDNVETYADYAHVRNTTEKVMELYEVDDSRSAVIAFVEKLYKEDKDTFIAVIAELYALSPATVLAEIHNIVIDNPDLRYGISSVIDLFSTGHNISLATTSDVVETATLVSTLTESWKGSSRSLGAQLLQYYVADLTGTTKPSFFNHNCSEEMFNSFVKWLHGSNVEANIKRYVKDVYETTQKELKAKYYAEKKLSEEPSDDYMITLYRGVTSSYNTSSTLESWTESSDVAYDFDGSDVFRRDIPIKAVYVFWKSKNWLHKEVGSVFETEKEHVLITDMIPAALIEDEKEKKLTATDRLAEIKDLLITIADANSVYFHAGSAYGEDIELLKLAIVYAGGAHTNDLKNAFNLSYEDAEQASEAINKYWKNYQIDEMLDEAKYTEHPEQLEVQPYDTAVAMLSPNFVVDPLNRQHIIDMINFVGMGNVTAQGIANKLLLPDDKALELYQKLENNWHTIWENTQFSMEDSKKMSEMAISEAISESGGESKLLFADELSEVWAKSYLDNPANTTYFFTTEQRAKLNYILDYVQEYPKVMQSGLWSDQAKDIINKYRDALAEENNMKSIADYIKVKGIDDVKESALKTLYNWLGPKVANQTHLVLGMTSEETDSLYTRLDDMYGVFAGL